MLLVSFLILKIVIYVEFSEKYARQHGFFKYLPIFYVQFYQRLDPIISGYLMGVPSVH